MDLRQHDVTQVRGPYLDIEVLARASLGAKGAEADVEAEACERARHLLGPLRGEADLLVSLGDPEVHGEPGDLDLAAVWARALERLERPESMAAGGDTPGVRRVFAVTGSETDSAVHAYVAVVALARGEDAGEAQAFVRTLADSEPCRVAPLYVIGLDPLGTIDPAPWEQVRASIVLTPATEASTEILTMSRTPIDARQRTADVSFVPCPTFRRGVGDPGSAGLRLDVVRAQAAIAFSHDDAPGHERPIVQVTRPLHSASRIASGERRLYQHVLDMLDREIRQLRDEREDVTELEEFRELVTTTWDEDGYVALCRASGTLPALEAPKSVTYMLLLLIRPRQGGGYELLLSNHSPLQPSTLAEWNTLLLPAFQHPATLLGHLRDDVMRQATERAEGLDRGDQARGFEEAVRRVLASDVEENVWMDEVREIANFRSYKISPTSGVVTEYDYHFVTLLPFVRPAAADDDAAGDVDRILAWFEGLDVVRDREPEVEGSPTLPMAALEAGGAGVRFEPAAELHAEPNVAQRARAHKAPPGAVWFPIGDPAEPPPWKRVPSIRARNADVMTQLDQLLERHLETGTLPGELLLGGGAGGHGYDVLETYSFGEPHPHPAPRVPASCTRDALAKVEFAGRSDLRGQLAYPEGNVRRVYLLRAGVGARGEDRDAILVLAKEDAEAKTLEDLGQEDALGRLRPVQRYVLESGLRRVADLQAALDEQKPGRDPWGFFRVRKDGIGIAVSVTPPIIEQLHAVDLGEPSDVGREARAVREFIVCDGSHRVIEQVWLSAPRRLVPAVLVDSQPAAPYYAYPFGSLEWGITARTRPNASPPQAAKYLVRSVDPDDPEQVPPQNRKQVAAVPPASRYRRYYRDLEGGFGSLGGQGGRFA